tara:strand:+ start:270 stop:1259 length:990 start_codon:yes stop_codon:yes gene_type:complete
MEEKKIIYHVCDWNFEPGYYKDKFPRHRFPHAWFDTGIFYLVSYKDVNEVIQGKNNIIWFNTPVHDELNKLKLIDTFIDNNDVYISGEGTIWEWMDEWPAPEQELYIKLLSKCKAYVVANEFDQHQVRLFAPRTLRVTPCTNHFIEEYRKELGEYIFLANPSKGYQRGMMSHKLTYDSAPKNMDIYSLKFDRAPHMGRNISLPDSYSMPGFKLLDRMDWDRFMAVTYNSRFGVDIHRNFSAGQTAVDFGSLGVPLVGNIKLDAQRIIFPDLSFEWDEYENIKECIHLLSVDDDFCLDMGKKALENTKKYYNSVDVLSDFITRFNIMQNS